MVFRVCHQLHGAVGFCDETTLSWLSRYSQPLRRLPFGLSATRDELTRRVGRRRPHGTVRVTADLDEFRRHGAGLVRRAHPADWRQAQTGVGDEEFVRFQKAWFAELHSAGFAVPHWPREWGGGMSVAEQIVLYQELAAHDAPRLVLAFVGIHHAASTLLVAGTDEQRRRHLPAILDGEIWVQGFSEPEAGSDLAEPAHHGPPGWRRLRRQRPEAVGQRRYARRLVPAAGPHRSGCTEAQRHFVLPAGHDDARASRCGPSATRSAIRTSARSSSTTSTIPAANLVGAENAGWQVAQATLGAERGMTMLELAERLGNAGFRWLVEMPARLDDPLVADRLAQFETEITGLRGLCRTAGGATARRAPPAPPTRRSSSCTTASCCSG